jgi:hypothetical protein
LKQLVTKLKEKKEEEMKNERKYKNNSPAPQTPQQTKGYTNT